MIMRDKIVAIIEDGIGDGLDLGDLAGVILAAMPGMIPELVWHEASPCFFHATPPMHMDGYTIVTHRGILSWAYSQDEGPTIAPTLESAKAAANAHHRAAMCEAMGWAG